MIRYTIVLLTAWIAAPVLAGPNVVIVLDDSGSMATPMESGGGQKRIDAAKSALLTVLEQIPDDAEVGLLLLNGGDRRETWSIPLSPLSRNDLQQKIEAIRAGGNTPLGTRIKQAADALLELRARQPYGEFKLLVVTDGEATDGKLVEQYLPDILSRGLQVDVIGVDMRQDHSLATRVHTYRRANDRAALEQALSELVLGESAPADDAAAESDYDLLRGFPDEVAAAALSAMTQTENAPIQIRPERSQPVVTVRPKPSQPPMLPATPKPAVARPGISMMIVLLLGVVLVGVMALVMFVLVAMKAR